MLRHGLYARKSEKDHDEVIQSIADQKSVCLGVAERAGCVVAATYEENQTAKIPGVRPVYDQLIKDIKTGRINAILTYHVNRLARNMLEAGQLAQLLIDGNLHEIRTPTAVYTSADNILPLLLEQGTATQFSRDLSRRMKDATAQSAAAGGWPRVAPVGYLTQRHPLYPKKTIVVEDPERFSRVRELFELVLQERRTLQEIVEIANTQWGFRLRATPKQPLRPLRRSTAYGILTNPFYAGLVTHKGQVYPGKHRPMVTAAEFAQVQGILHRSQRTYRRRNLLTYVGVMRCGYCGAQVTGELHVRGERRYVYYRCTNTNGRCTKRGISEAELEQQILNTLANTRIDAAAGRILIGCLMGQEARRHEREREHIHEARERLKALDQQRDRLVDLMVSGAITDRELYRRKEAALLEERAQAQQILTVSETSHADQIATAQAAVSFLDQALLRFGAADRHQKKAICMALGHSYRLRGRELTIEVAPLLREIVRIVRPVEKPDVSFGTGQSPSKKVACQSGVPDETQIELPDDFVKLLETERFHDPLDNELTFR